MTEENEGGGMAVLDSLVAHLSEVMSRGPVEMQILRRDFHFSSFVHWIWALTIHVLHVLSRSLGLTLFFCGGRSTLRFTTSKPTDTVIYSADFTIVPANTTGPTTGSGTGMRSGAVAVATQSGSRTGSGSTTVTATGSSTWTTTAASASGVGSTTPSGVPPPLGTIPGGPGQAGQRAASAGRRGVDVDKLKFRFVFVIWPVLMGITMAL